MKLAMKLAYMKNTGFVALLCLAMAATSYAADAPVAPAADTSADQSADRPTVPSANDTQAPAAAKPQASAPARKPLSASALPRSSTSPSSSVAGIRKTADRLDLDTTNVTGNRELPKVLYIVPWKKADIGELPAQPFNTLLDEVLTPVDRDVFRREVTYYGAIAAGSDAIAGGAAPPVGSSPRSEK